MYEQAKVRPSPEIRPLSSSQLPETYPIVTEPKRVWKRALAPPSQFNPITGPILHMPGGVRRSEIAVQRTATKATGSKIVNTIALSNVAPPSGLLCLSRF